VYAYLWDRLNQLEQEIEDLKQENQELRQKIGSIQPLQVDSIQYKVQELHVENLNGTLDIGLNIQADDENIAQMIEKMKDGENTQFQVGDTDTADADPDESIPVHKESSAEENKEVDVKEET